MEIRQIKEVISEAKNEDYFASLPLSFLRLDIPSPPTTNDEGKTLLARIEHFTSPLSPGLLEQCLKLFDENMGGLYRSSSWGLNLEEKRKELMHHDARYLIVLANDKINDSEISSTPLVLGFAHYRYEEDDEDDPTAPVSYLYELQIRSMQQKAGIGKRLMNIVELLALKSRMHKVMLTVFKNNAKAMGFYFKMKYEIDECSPSNFEGDENESCDYEILSKSLVRQAK